MVPNGGSVPWLQDADVTLYHGDVLTTLRELPAESVDCVVTSPPYWGLRDYGTGAWEGGDAECDHLGTPFRTKSNLNENWGAGFSDVKNSEGREPMGQQCSKCGATRIDQQLGLEPTPEQYVERMVEVFREVRRVLAAHGTVWLNLGDSYAGSWSGNSMRPEGGSQREGGPGFQPLDERVPARSGNVPAGLKPKDLVGIPWRVAFALQADGWYLRSDIIWAKPNPMPESVMDRPTKAHEYVFLLSKQPRYFFDQEAVREQSKDPADDLRRVRGDVVNGYNRKHSEGGTSAFQTRDLEAVAARIAAGRNIRSVWEIATQPYPEAHFATFPEELARRCIAAGCPEQVCRVCGKARERVVERTPEPRPWTTKYFPDRNDGGNPASVRVRVETLGFTDCGCRASKYEQSHYRPGIVLDPFMGSGTVAYVARKLGRHAVGIDLSEEYLELAARRLQQQSLLAELSA